MGMIQEVQERLRAAKHERLRVAAERLRWQGDNRRFRAEHPDFPMPSYPLLLDAYGHTSWEGYLRHGHEHAKLIAEKIRKYAPGVHNGAGGPVVLDWGCGPGRVIRLLGEYLAPLKPEIHGTDYNPATIRWCRKNLPGIHFERNETSPPLPFPDGRIDALYSISVFTHLSEAQHFSWRDEIIRLLAPGGVAIVTLHGDRFIQYLSTEDAAQYQDGNLVVSEFAAEGKRDFQAYHPPSWVRANLLGSLECLEHDERELFDWFHQDIWVLRKTLPQA